MAAELQSTSEGLTMVLTISNPEHRNALGPEIYAAGVEALNAAESSAEVRSVVIAGEGAVFSAGGNLQRLQANRQQPPEIQARSIEGLYVTFDGATSAVELQGTAPSQEASEKAALCCGNVGGVGSVNNMLAVSDSAGESQFHDVVRGDTLSAIAKEYYGNAGKYPVIFEANKPMLSHPDKIYPGQKLRIPPLA